LRFAGETLGEDGVAISPAELSELHAEIVELQKTIHASTLPQDIKRFVLEQLEIILRAIRDYPLAGTKAFKTAVQEAIFHTGEHAEVVAEYQDTPVIGKLKTIQQQVLKYAKYTIEVSKFLASVEN